MKANKNLQRLLSILLSGAMIASAPMSAWADDFTDAAAQVESVQTEENTQDEVQQDAADADAADAVADTAEDAALQKTRRTIYRRRLRKNWRLRRIRARQRNLEMIPQLDLQMETRQP